MSRPFVAAAVALVVLAMSFSGADAQGCTITVGADTFDLGPLAGEYSTPNEVYPTYTEHIGMCGTVIVCGTGGSTIAVCEKSATGTGSPMGMYPSTLAAGGSTNNPSAVFSMTFTKATGSIYTVFIDFTCGTAAGAPVYSKEGGGSMYFAWSTMYACPGGVPVPTDGTPGSDDGTSSGGLSGGDVFLIIFFVGFALYFIIGAAIMYQKYEARGIEMIPNKEFWTTDLPGLLRDGVQFTGTKIKGLVSGSSSS